MKDFVLYCDEGLTEAEIENLQNALQGAKRTDVPLALEVLFVGEEEIRELNREQRKVDKITDVLSFPTLDGIIEKPIEQKDYPYDIDENGNLFIGSIVICKKRAREQAEEYGHSFNRELHYLIVHGVMHCLGYDHEEETDKAKMREMEEKVLKKAGITRQEEEQ
ncbi:MAG: rRNA maturation RNase YbeY [Clostridia bacterium]|nr:rRNA maturation RNase YbeY [Clostridia bacterium]